MANYYVDTTPQANGRHEVHTDACEHFREMKGPQHLGEFHYCKTAIEIARSYYSQVSGCGICSPECQDT